MTLEEVATRAKITKSMLSQIENNKANPSLKSLMGIAGAMDVTIGSFFEEDTSGGHVVRAVERKLVRTGDGISYYLLTPSLRNTPVEFLYCVYESGATSGPLHSHQGVESGIVLSGRLKIVLEETAFIVEEGDSFIFESDQPHYAENPGEGRTIIIWVNTPPTF